MRQETEQCPTLLLDAHRRRKTSRHHSFRHTPRGESVVTLFEKHFEGGQSDVTLRSLL